MSAWPLFDLRIKTPQLTLRLSQDAELMSLAERAVGNVLPEERSEFMGPWTQIPSPEFERSFMQHHWLMRANWKPEAWTLDFGIYPEGSEEPAGMMGIVGKSFVESRSVSTGSWLLPEWRGQGLGREAREAILHLAFSGLGAREARSGAHPKNAPSHGVSRSLGYQPDGTEMLLTAGGAREVIRLLLRRDKWEKGCRGDIEIRGLDACLEMFGLSQDD